jgi:hypothetical protein
MQGMCTNFESETELPDLGCRHRLILGGHRDVKCAAQTMLREQLGHTQIQRMAVVPTGRDEGRRFHDRLSIYCAPSRNRHIVSEFLNWFDRGETIELSASEVLHLYDGRRSF